MNQDLNLCNSHDFSFVVKPRNSFPFLLSGDLDRDGYLEIIISVVI